MSNIRPFEAAMSQGTYRNPTDSNWSLLRMVQLHICFYQWFTKLTSHVLMHFSCSNFNGGCFSECPTFTFSEFLTFCSQFPLSFSKFSLPNFQFLFHGMRIPLSPWVMAEAFGRHRVVPGIHRRIMKSLPCVFFWCGQWRAYVNGLVEGKIWTGNRGFHHQFARVSVVNFPIIQFYECR